MKERKAPREKKDLEYSRDTRVIAEHPKAYRKSKPRKKKWANQGERRRLDRLMDAAIKKGAAEEITPASFKPRSRSTIINLTSPLGEVIERQKVNRIGRQGRKNWKRKVAAKLAELRDAIKENGTRFAKVIYVGESWGADVTVSFRGTVATPAALRELKENRHALCSAPNIL